MVHNHFSAANIYENAFHCCMEPTFEQKLPPANQPEVATLPYWGCLAHRAVRNSNCKTRSLSAHPSGLRGFLCFRLT